MTTTRTYDPASAGTALPDLPPLPIGALAAGATELLQQAADLLAPVYVAIFDNQHIHVQFDGTDPASPRAITRWARRFGGIVISQPGKGRDGTETWYHTEFDYYGVSVRAYAHIPATPATT